MLATMTSERWAEIVASFEEAATLDGPQRVEYLSGLEPTLRSEVESLLSHSSDTHDDVDRAVVDAARGALGVGPALVAGQQIGGYTVVRSLGAGGMGEVFLATDDRLRRQVAIKVVRPGAVRDLTRDLLLREAQALARVTHPNVVTVYEVGLFGDQVFIAMEYVAGTTLREWLRAEPRAWRIAVRQLTAAARGLAAAHAANLVHRDFKPENILVGDDGRARVVDFGLAGAAEVGAVAGTPAYAAPEQKAGGFGDALSDQFAFGVTLGEAVTGAPAWIRAIVARTTAPEPRDRFASMTDVVTALGRDPAVRRRWIGGAVLVTGLAVIALVGWGRDREAAVDPCPGADIRLAGVWDATMQANLRTRFDVSGRPYAKTVADRVVTALDGYGKAWVDERRDACRATAVRHEQSDAVLDLRMRCFDRRAGELAALTQVFTTSTEPLVVDRAVQAVSDLTPLASCADSARLAETMPPPAGSDAAIATLQARLDSVRAQIDTGKESGHVDEMQSIVQAAQAIHYPRLHAQALLLLSDAQRFTDKLADAVISLDAALETASLAHDDVLVARSAKMRVIVANLVKGPEVALAFVPAARAAIARAGNPPSLVADLAVKHSSVLDAAGNYPAARKTAEEAHATYASGVGTPLDLARSLNQLSLVLADQGEHDAARARLSEALAIWERELSAEHPNIGGVLLNLAILDSDAGDYVAAELHQRRSLAIWEKVYGPEHRNVASALSNLAQTLRLTKRYDEARTLGERALAIKTKVFGENHAQITTTLGVLGFIATEQRDLPAALAYHQRALAIREKTFAPAHVMLADSHDLIGDVRQEQGDLADARAHYDRAVAIWRKAVGPVHQDLARGLGSLAENDFRANRLAAAETHIREALAIDEKIFGESGVKLTYRLRLLAKVLMRARKFAELRDTARRWLAIAETHASVPDQLGAAIALGDALLALGKPAEAIEPLERSLASSAGQPDAIKASLQFELARALWDGGGDKRHAVELAESAARGVARADARPIAAWIATHPSPH